MPVANSGERVPEERESAESVATADPARVTVTTYLLVVVPSGAVTSILKVFNPTTRPDNHAVWIW